MSMHLSSRLRTVLMVSGALLLLGVCGVIGLRLMFSRTREFRAQARAGQPILRAIEAFRKQTGSYPASLADLAPKYLAVVPELPDESQSRFTGWDYRTVTNGVAVSYTLRYYMGRGGVEYEPPNWTGNDEAHRTIILKNE
ncbi:MAG: hypothetical protein WCT12_15960 [Verrucomicrobiota bacterium]